MSARSILFASIRQSLGVTGDEPASGSQPKRPNSLPAMPSQKIASDVANR